MVDESTVLTRKEAAVACGCSEDTLRRDQRLGRLPNTRRGSDGSILYVVADLVAAGRLGKSEATGPVVEVVGRSRAERDLVAARTELAVANARITELSARIERQEDEITFLRSLVAPARVA